MVHQAQKQMASKNIYDGVFAGKVQVAMINQYMGVAPSTFQMVYLRFDWVYPLLKGFLKNLNS